MSKDAELAHLFRALKMPAAARALGAIADRARAESWSYERFAEALLSTEVSARDSHGGEGRIKTARFPARKTLEEFDFTFQRSVKKTVIEHLGQLDFLHGKQNVILLGPPGTGKTDIATALGIRAGGISLHSPTARCARSRRNPTPREVTFNRRQPSSGLILNRP
jgi:DNA replication protein DnaC